MTVHIPTNIAGKEKEGGTLYSAPAMPPPWLALEPGIGAGDFTQLFLMKEGITQGELTADAELLNRAGHYVIFLVWGESKFGLYADQK